MRFIFNMTRALRHMMMCEERTDRRREERLKGNTGEIKMSCWSLLHSQLHSGREEEILHVRRQTKTEFNKINKDFKAVRVTDPEALKSTNSHRSPGENTKRFTASHLQSWMFETVTLSPWWNVLEFFVDPYSMFNAFVYVFVFVVDVKWIRVFSGNQINV